MTINYPTDCFFIFNELECLRKDGLEREKREGDERRRRSRH
jgi:hypothetical protein